MPLSVSVLFSPRISLGNPKHIFTIKRLIIEAYMDMNPFLRSFSQINLIFKNFPRILSEINCGLHCLIWTCDKRTLQYKHYI